MDYLGLIPWDAFGAGSVVFLIVIVVIRGDFIPRRTHNEITSLLKESIAVERTANAELRTALRIVAIEHGTTTDKVLNSLPVFTGGGGDGE